jgi:hypothetical protein
MCKQDIAQRVKTAFVKFMEYADAFDGPSRTDQPWQKKVILDQARVAISGTVPELPSSWECPGI